MPSVRYYNQTAPFWDFIASLEEQGASHPFFSGNRQQANAGNEESDNNAQTTNPWTDGWAGGFPFGPGAWGGTFPHRGRFGPPHGHPNGPPRGPPPPAGDHNTPDPPEQAPGDGSSSEPRGPPPPFTEKPTDCNNNDNAGESEQGPGPHHHRRGGCGGRGGCRGRGGMRGGPGAWARHHHHHHRGSGFPGPMGGFGALAEMFQSHFFGENSAVQERDSASFTPDIDVFDTPSAFIIHVSLPGAKKDDVGVNYDSEKSELSVSGVSYRPADEELLNHLAMDERKVGMFERKVRLGSRANPAQVDIEGISAKLEEGILRVEVPKVVPEEEGFVEVKKVDIE